MDQAVAKASGKSGRRRLGEKQKLLFAPMSDVGGVLVDKDAVYIDVKTSTFSKDQEEDPERGLGEQMVIDLQSGKKLLGEVDDRVRLFSGAQFLSADAEKEDSGRKEARHGRTIEKGEDDEDDYDSQDISDDEDQDEDEDFASDDDERENGTNGNMANRHVSEERLGKSFKSNADDSASQSLRDDAIAFADSDSDIGSVSSVDDQDPRERYELIRG